MSSASPLEPSEPPSKINTNNLTYGIEIEFVFAFHEDLIVFPNDAEYKTVKNLPYSTRLLPRFSRVNPLFTPNRTYNSWGIESSSPDKVTKETLNPWKKEPLQLVAKILRQTIPAFAASNASRDLNVLDTLENADKRKLVWDNRKQWKITKDHSVCGVGSSNIEKWLPGKDVEFLSVSPLIKQQLSHQLIAGRFVKIRLKHPLQHMNDWQWVTKSRLGKYAFPRFINQFLRQKTEQARLS